MCKWVETYTSWISLVNWYLYIHPYVKILQGEKMSNHNKWYVKATIALTFYVGLVATYAWAL